MWRWSLPLIGGVLILGVVIGATPGSLPLAETKEAAPAIAEDKSARPRSSFDSGAHGRLWRGKPPQICLVRGCPSPEPTFCAVDERRDVRTKLELKVSDDCDRDADIRDADQGTGIRTARTTDR
ncbi:MAG: hypothetical protein M3N53_06380 [Actinomycetota bacterium]|nr:hypothetical protein [Actinomycetota bacterium]